MTTFDHHALTLFHPRAPNLRMILAVWLRRHRTRHHLRALEHHRLADIGLSGDDRRRECAKWFWAP